MKNASRKITMLLCVIQMLFAIGCLSPPEADLRCWLGEYYYGEGTDARNFRGTTINIFMNENNYYADIVINGWLTGMKAKAKIQGDEEQIDIIFLEYPHDGGSTIDLVFQEGDHLLSLVKANENILTKWERIQPLEGTEFSDICFTKKYLSEAM